MPSIAAMPLLKFHARYSPASGPHSMSTMWLAREIEVGFINRE